MPAPASPPTCPPADRLDLPGVAPLLPVVGADLLAPLVTGGHARYVNLDYAASAPALVQVAERVAEVLPCYASVHRGAGYASQVSTALLETARQVVARFVGARTDDVVVFTRNTTDALNLLAGCVPGPAAVVFLELEHHANMLPWQRGPHRYLPVRASIGQTLQALESALRDQPTALVAVTGASNVTGEVLPVREIAALAHRHGARVVVDGAQLVPHRRVDLAGSDVDYLAFSGHKLYAPYGSGVLVGRRDWLDQGTPYLAGGGAVRRVELTGVSWAASPQRHEGGTPNVLGAAALAAACTALAELPTTALPAHEAALRSRLVHGLSGLPGVRLHRIFDDAPTPIGVVTFTVDQHPAGRVAAYLSAEHGIGVRDGSFCAHPLLARLGLSEGAVRVSVGVGSRSADVDRLVVALQALGEDGPRWTYEALDGRWQPTPDPRPLPSWAAGLARPAAPCAAAGD